MDVSYRTIYEGFEKIVRTRAKSEGNMFEGYSMREAMGFCIEYMKDLKNVN